MPKFSDVCGQDHIKRHLQKSISANRISHAYIFNGEKGAGKEYLAEAFAMTVLCEEGGSEPCGHCKSCKQFVSNNQPDFSRLIKEKPSRIGVDEIRAQVVDDIVIKPYSSNWKIYIINEAEKMTVQAMNALLKTLEEPPAYAIIILLTSNINMILDTIKSRCTILNFHPVEDSIIKKYLMEELKTPDYKADICISFARGNIGKARSLAMSEDFDNLKDDIVHILKSVHDMDVGELNHTISILEENKDSINECLDIMLIFYRDILIYKAGHKSDRLVFKGELTSISRGAEEMSYEGIDTVIKAIDIARSRIQASVNFNMTMELLLMTMKEN